MKVWSGSWLTPVVCILHLRFLDTFHHVRAQLPDSASENIRQSVAQNLTPVGYRTVHSPTVGVGSSEISAVGEGQCMALVGKDDRGGSQRSWVVPGTMVAYIQGCWLRSVG